MKEIRLYISRSLFLVSILVLFYCRAVGAAEDAGADDQSLRSVYQSISGKLARNQYGAPIYVESKETGGGVQVDMYGTFNYPFAVIEDALQYPPNWCDITLLHINIKACTSNKKDDQWLLTLYSGRKFYQPPKDAKPLKFKFRVLSAQPQYLDLALAADSGPLSTKDHRIKLQAIPVEGNRTFLHFSYAYSSGAMARMAIRSYFATIGRDKVGFSTVRRDGKAYYVDGVRGAIERNTVRYYLALESYVETLRYPERQRFEQRISRWYDLTARYRQLKENEKGEYLAAKRKELANQIALQNKGAS